MLASACRNSDDELKRLALQSSLPSHTVWQGGSIQPLLKDTLVALAYIHVVADL